MLYQKKRKIIDPPEKKQKKDEDSTGYSDRVLSNEKLSQLSGTNRKSFTKIFNKRTLNKKTSQKTLPEEKVQLLVSQNKRDNHQKQSLDSNNQFQSYHSKNQFPKTQNEQSKQKFASTNTFSTCSLQPNGQPGQNGNKKKFKLYCQVKKKKQTQKKSEYEKQTDRFGASSTVSESWIKNSIFSRGSQKHDSASTKKSKERGQRSLKRKIDLTEKIRQIRSKQKQRESVEKQQISTAKTLELEVKESDNFSKVGQKILRSNKKSVEKKHSTVSIKRSLVLSKLNSSKQQQSRTAIEASDNSSVEQYKQPKQKEISQAVLSHKKLSFKMVENKILPQDSQIIEQSVKKLSEIKEEKNEETISRSIKPLQINSVDQSKSKDHEQTSMHLSINSICKDRKSYGCILQTTQLRQSALKREIQSSLSELQKSRQKIDIKKFDGLKIIAELGSEISEVQQNMTTVQKIQFHIELINTLSNFVYKSTELEYLMEEWDELNFLIYKKFYLERTKVLNFLKKYPIKNPFCIKRASIETKQVLKALRQNEADIKRIKNALQSENAIIKKNLETFYNQFSKQKHGQKINLLEYDNFSHWIYKQIWDEIQLFSYSQSHNQLQLQDRICKSLQAGFLISELNGNYVTPFEDAQIASRNCRQKVYIDDNLQLFERYVLNKKK